MFDLRKPLEGAPGLLLMAALILFGATIGISVAIVVKWIEMGDALANFLGGVVGAGLGAALAVVGAVYVQRLDARERLTTPRNRLQTKSEALGVSLGRLETFLENLVPGMEGGADWGISAQLAKEARSVLSELPEGEELPRDVHLKALRVKRIAANALNSVEAYLLRHEAGAATESQYTTTTLRLGRCIKEVDELVILVRAL